jgi:DNA-binding SARP family transcriptional activator
MVASPPEGSMMKSIRLLASRCMVVAEPAPVPVKARKVQALLAFLALNRAAHSREALATLLWGDHDDVHARHSLNQCVHELRQTIEDTAQSVICSDGDDLRLDRRAINVDVDEFEAAVAEGSRSSLMRAPELYAHDLLTGLKIRSDAFDSWLNAERRRLRDLACRALQRLAELQTADGNLDGACALARRAVALDPSCESAHRRLMRIYAERGDHAAAERQYRSCHELVDREFSLGPEIETVKLRDEIQGMRHGMAVKSSAPLSGPPSVAVNPFISIGGDSDASHFARGLTGDVATALHRWSWIGVVLPNSIPEGASHPPGHSGGSIANRSDRRARYAVDGAVRKSGSRVRVTVQLVDTLTSSQIWAERFDRGVDDILAVQDEITNRIAGAVEPELLRHEAELSRRGGIDQDDAYDLFRLGFWHLQRFNPADNAKAIHLLRRSARLDPGLLQASVGLARAILTEWSYGWSKDAQGDHDELLCVLDHLIELDHSDPYCHYLTAATCLLGRHHEDARAAAASAVELNPCFALGHFLLGQASLLTGRHEAAAESINAGLRLDPRNV